METEAIANFNPTQRQLENTLTTAITEYIFANMPSPFHTSYVVRDR